MARKLEVSPQAILKHIRTLEDQGIVTSVSIPRREGVVRRLYRPSLPLTVDMGVEGRVRHMNIYIMTLEEKGVELTEVLGESLLDAVKRIEDEKYLLKRRLKMIRDRGVKVFRELAALSAAEADLFLKEKLSDLEVAVLLAYVNTDEEGFREASHYLKISEEKARELVDHIAARMLSSQT